MLIITRMWASHDAKKVIFPTFHFFRFSSVLQLDLEQFEFYLKLFLFAKSNFYFFQRKIKICVWLFPIESQSGSHWLAKWVLGSRVSFAQSPCLRLIKDFRSESHCVRLGRLTVRWPMRLNVMYSIRSSACWRISTVSVIWWTDFLLRNLCSKCSWNLLIFRFISWLTIFVFVKVRLTLVLLYEFNKT